jgi:hypothetical protein
MMAEMIGHHGYAKKEDVGLSPSSINDWNDHPWYGIRLGGLGDRGRLDGRRPHGGRHGFRRHAPPRGRGPYGVLNSRGSPCVFAFCSSKGSSRGWAFWHSILRFRWGSVFRFLQKDRLTKPVFLIHTRAFFGQMRYNRRSERRAVPPPLGLTLS